MELVNCKSVRIHHGGRRQTRSRYYSYRWKIYIHPNTPISEQQDLPRWIHEGRQDSPTKESQLLHVSGLRSLLRRWFLVQGKREAAKAVTLIPVQQQEGSTDCGLFSIAAAYSAACGKNLRSITYDQEQMRAHLEKCFEEEKLSPFPVSKRAVHRCRLKHLFVGVYCWCRQPESFDTHMIECEKCLKWFHFRCMGLESVPDNWCCFTCRTS